MNLFSSVTGKKIGFIYKAYGNGELRDREIFIGAGITSNGAVCFEGNCRTGLKYDQPGGTSFVLANDRRTYNSTDGNSDMKVKEHDALGNDFPTVDPAPDPPPHFPTYDEFGDIPPFGGDPTSADDRCTLDGALFPCPDVIHALNSGQAAQCPNNQCITKVKYNGIETFASFTFYADGFAGYVPHNSNYIGHGTVSAIDPLRGKYRWEDTELSKLNESVTEADLRFIGVDEYWARSRQDLNPDRRSRVPVVDSYLDALRYYLSEALARETCKAFIDKFVGGADLLKVFDLVRVQQGIAWNRLDGGTGAEAFGVVARTQSGTDVQGAGMNLRNKYQRAYTALGGGSALMDVDVTALLIGDLIHELIHNSSNGRDDPGMLKILKDAGANTYGLSADQAKDKSKTHVSSFNWNLILEDACGINGKQLQSW